MAYHEGETGAKTPYSHMHKLINRYCIADTTLGGDYFKQMEEPCGYEIKALHKASDAGKAMRDSIAAVLIEPAPVEDRPQEWIPCSERLPKDLEVVNITWINHRPMTYYADIKDEPFTATAIHYKDKWWRYSPICEDLLEEYGKSECDKMDSAIEVLAWMPLPEQMERSE